MTRRNQSANTLDRGLNKLPRKASARVTEARKAAIRAQKAVEKRALKLYKDSQTFVYEQPVAAAELVSDAGTLAGTLSTETCKEDKLSGCRRDQLMCHAKDVLNEELDKLHAAPSTKLDDATAHASDAFRNQ